MNWIIAGLGNPGPRYTHTLHNIGYKVVEALAEKHHWSWKNEPKFLAKLTKGKIKETTFHLIQPETFMNLSGESLSKYLREIKATIDQLIVVADDADLPIGSIRLKAEGGSGGHNGLKSISAHLNSNGFKRLRVGVRRPSENESLADYVLAPQTALFWGQFDQAIGRAIQVLEGLSDQNFEAAMKIANTQVSTGPLPL